MRENVNEREGGGEQRNNCIACGLRDAFRTECLVKMTKYKKECVCVSIMVITITFTFSILSPLPFPLQPFKWVVPAESVSRNRPRNRPQNPVLKRKPRVNRACGRPANETTIHPPIQQLPYHQKVISHARNISRHIVSPHTHCQNGS